MQRITLFLTICLVIMASASVLSQARAEITVRIAVVEVIEDKPLPISRLDLPPKNQGFAGGEMALADNNTTGRFLKQKFEAVEIQVKPEAIPAEIEKLAAVGTRIVVAMANSSSLTVLAEEAARHGMLVFNATAQDDELRRAGCAPNVFHVAPSNAQIADGLAQYMVWKPICL